MEQEIQDFYSHLQQRVFNHFAYKQLSEDTCEYLFQFVEKYLLCKLYGFVSNRLYHDCEEKDLEIQSRIRSFNWVTPEHLDAQLRVASSSSRFSSYSSSSFSSSSSDGVAADVDSRQLASEVGDAIDKAISAIIEMDAQRSPQDKLHAILGCASFIHDAIQASSPDRAVSADDFLPVFLYVILQANPPMLHSNITFISRFSLPQRVSEGESGYEKE